MTSRLADDAISRAADTTRQPGAAAVPAGMPRGHTPSAEPPPQADADGGHAHEWGIGGSRMLR